MRVIVTAMGNDAMNEMVNAIEGPLSARYAVPPALLETFRDAGFVHLRGILDAGVVDRYATAITRKVEELSTETRPIDERDDYGAAFLQVMNLWAQDDLVRELVCSRRLADIAAQLLGVAHVRLYLDQALYKEPGGRITPWHADQAYWPLSSDRTVTVWIPLQDTPLEMGPLAFSAGSHRVEAGRDLHISARSEREMEIELTKRDLPLVVEPFALGDVSYHLGWTFHRAGANQTEVPRRVMTMIYVDADIRVAEPRNAEQRHDHEHWLGMLPPGSLLSDGEHPILA